MVQVDEVPGAKLVETRLKLAQEALDKNNLIEAQDIFEKTLEVKGNHPERENQIRLKLKDFSDRVIAQDTPNWDLAHRALNMLDSLQLENEQTFLWRQELSLKQADFLLGWRDLEASFGIFKKLVAEKDQAFDQKELRTEIARIVRSHISQQAGQGDLSLLNQIIEQVQNLLAEDELRHWLETISKALDAADKVAAAQAQHERDQLIQANTAAAEQALREREWLIGQLRQVKTYNKWLLAGIAFTWILAIILIIFT